ncbi:hypothetical protein KSS87_020700 [Heliosperma pusillum]|nr:hypothetical protein KSS87_020700 [Heliosperma pusillum]
MLKSSALYLTSRFRVIGCQCQPHKYRFTTIPTPSPTPTQTQDRKWVENNDSREAVHHLSHPLGQRLTGKEKIRLLIKTLLDLGDSKDAVYGALDTWVAWEHNFPIAALKNVLLTLEKQQQWHRVVQVIKWMLSKGQGNTMGTYQQLIRALDMDHRADEAHNFWMKKIGNDLHSVPWQACHLMISVYLRNAMLDHLVKLFKGLEAFDRKPPDKLIVQKVADAYDLLDLIDDKERLLEKYDALLNRKTKECDKKSKKVKSRRKHTLSGLDIIRPGLENRSDSDMTVQTTRIYFISVRSSDLEIIEGVREVLQMPWKDVGQGLSNMRDTDT